MKKLRAANANFLFACLVCSVKVTSGKIQKQLRKAGEIEAYHENEVHQIKSAYETERTLMIKELEERDKALTKANREIDLIKIGEEAVPRGTTVSFLLHGKNPSSSQFPRRGIVNWRLTIEELHCSPSSQGCLTNSSQLNYRNMYLHSFQVHSTVLSRIEVPLPTCSPSRNSSTSSSHWVIRWTSSTLILPKRLTPWITPFLRRNLPSFRCRSHCTSVSCSSSSDVSIY